MKTFDFESIKQRMLQKAATDDKLSAIVENGDFDLLLTCVAASNAELARYVEYCLAERTWDTARNQTSLIMKSRPLGYKPLRKMSSIGEVIVSHDSNLRNLGITFFDLNQIEGGLDNYTGNSNIIIPKGTVFSDGNSEFISLEQKAIMNTTPEGETNFDGYKYVRIPVLQGRIKESELTTSTLGLDFEKYQLYSENIEAASRTVSESFLKVFLIAGETEIECPIVDSILKATSDNYYCEVDNNATRTGIIIKFGNNINGKRLPAGASIKVQYLETKGINGNVTEKYEVTNIVSTIPNAPTLYATNIEAILGGEDEESIEAIKEKAPLKYLEYYTIGTNADYKAQIMTSYPGLNKLQVFAGQYFDTQTNTIRDTIYITAIDVLGNPIGDPTTFLNTIINAIGDNKPPNDTFKYIDPELIRLRFNITAYTETAARSDSEIVTAMKDRLLSKYSIFTSQFKQPFYYSDFITTASLDENVKYITSFIEASVDVNLLDFEILSEQYGGYFKFYFDFSKVFGADEFNLGFKNHLNSNKTYLIRFELSWSSNTNSYKNRTLFLLDPREITNINAPLVLAQYPYLQNMVFDTQTMVTKIMPIDSTPNEIKYYVYDFNGEIVYDIDPSTGTPVKRKNTSYIGKNADPLTFDPSETEVTVKNAFELTADFNEEYDVNSPIYAKGYIQLPGSYLSDTIISTGDSTAIYEHARQELLTLSQQFKIKVYAEPVSENIFPQNWNDLIYSESNEIVVERIISWQATAN